MLGVLFLSLTGFVVGSPMVGSPQCTWGPTYWCATIPQASECRAVKHCIKSVWEKELVPQDDDEVCQICKEMVGEARDTLMSNTTQEELKEVFDGSCDLIPIKLVAKECRALADQFVPELVETLASEMNPDTVCTVSGLCNSARIDRLLEERNQNMIQMGGDCNICRVGAASTKKKIQMAAPERVEEKLLELCGYLGSFSDACMVTVLEQWSNIYSTLTETDWDTEICDLSGICSEAFQMVPATPMPEGEDIQCEFCEKVIKHWVDVYASNSSLAEFKEMLDGICEKLDKNNADHCKHVVDDYYIPAFEFIKNEIDPHTICSLVGLCQNEGDDVALEVHQVLQVPLVPAYTSLDNSIDVGDLEGSSSCDMCQMVLTEVFSVLKDPSDQRMVENVLESICYRLPDSWETNCENFVERYTGMILDFIVSGLNPNGVCIAMDLCENTQLPVTPSPPIGDIECTLCETVITQLDTMLEDKSTQEEIKAALEEVCSMLPQSIVAKCDTFVETYMEIVIDMLTKDVTPEMICSNLGLCKDGRLLPVEVVEVDTIVVDGPRVGGAYCTLCDELVSNLESRIQDKGNEEEIKNALDIVCFHLSTPVQKKCTKLVSKYTDELIEMITHDYPPNVICAELGLCVDHEISSNDISQINYQIVEVTRNIENEVSCEICEFAVQIIDEHLGDASTVDQIERELQFVCSYMPSSIAEKCEALVDKYGEKLIEALIKEEMDPQKVCTEVVPACQSKLGCIWGPNMWCASPFHARMCHATTLCQ